MKKATSIPGETYCKEHQGNHSHYDQRNCTVCQLMAEVQLLQRALAFWLPKVPADDSLAEKCQRIGDDAYLLAGYVGSAEKCAEELGWVKLQ